MPIYEYECAECHRRTSVLTLRVREKAKPHCGKCGSRKMHRLMSRFAVPRSEESRMDALADPANFAGLDEKDPKSLARAMRKMGREMGDEFSGPEFDDAVNELESGGDLGDGDNAGGDDDDL
jgi:putative FmdB family regulatory protein